MQVMKKTFVYALLAFILVCSFSSITHAQTACSASSVTTDSCYEHACTGQSSEDSPSCNAYAASVVNRDDGGDATCVSITTSNEGTCCPDDGSDLSPMCVAYNDYTPADVQDANGGAAGLPASTATAGAAQNTSVPHANGGAAGLPASTATAGAAQNTSVPLNIHLNNPLSGGGVSTIPDAINKILSIVIRIALPLIIVFFIWSGLSFIFARGNPEKVKAAKNMFLYTVIGTLLILGAWVITNAIIGTVNAIIS
jgi:hypothetical protein